MKRETLTVSAAYVIYPFSTLGRECEIILHTVCWHILKYATWWTQIRASKIWLSIYIQINLTCFLFVCCCFFFTQAPIKKIVISWYESIFVNSLPSIVTGCSKKVPRVSVMLTSMRSCQGASLSSNILMIRMSFKGFVEQFV